MNDNMNYIQLETLSGRILFTKADYLDDKSTIQDLKRRISTEYESDSEIGKSEEFYLFTKDNKKLNDNDTISNSEESKSLIIRRKKYSSFLEHFLKKLPLKKRWFLRIIFIIIGSLFIAAFAQISFYIKGINEDVPYSFQNFAILLIGTLYGWKLGVITVLLYLIEGLCGLPFLADQTGGYKQFIGDSAGYLYGFLLAAFVTGFLAERGYDRYYILHWKSSLIAMLLGDLSIYLIGVPVLWSHIGFVPALKYGFVPFIPGDLIKIAIGFIILPSLWKGIAFIFNRRSSKKFTYQNFFSS